MSYVRERKGFTNRAWISNRSVYYAQKLLLHKCLTNSRCFGLCWKTRSLGKMHFTWVVEVRCLWPQEVEILVFYLRWQVDRWWFCLFLWRMFSHSLCYVIISLFVVIMLKCKVLQIMHCNTRYYKLQNKILYSWHVLAFITAG